MALRPFRLFDASTFTPFFLPPSDPPFVAAPVIASTAMLGSDALFTISLAGLSAQPLIDGKPQRSLSATMG